MSQPSHRAANDAGNNFDAAYAGDEFDAAIAGDEFDAAYAGDEFDAAIAGDEFDAAIAGDAPSMAGNGLIDAAQARLLDFVEDGRAELVRGFDGLVALANEVAAKVDSLGGGSALAAPVADLAYQAAGIIGSVQARLRDKPIDELLDDGRALLRESPGLAGSVAFAAAFLVTRLIKVNR